SLSSKEAKGQFVYNQLTTTANATQPAVLQTLAQFGVAHQGFWVTNAIWAKGGTAVLQAVASRPDVAYVYASGFGKLETPPKNQALTSTNSITSINGATADPNPEANLIN